LTEAILVCLIGGLIGAAVAMGFGVLFAATVSSFSLVCSGASIVVAFLCSTLVGVIFGYRPAGRGRPSRQPATAGPGAASMHGSFDKEAARRGVDLPGPATRAVVSAGTRARRR